MYGKSSALSSYGRIANSDNDPLQQIVMLYDGAIKFLRVAATNIESKDIPKRPSTSIGRSTFSIIFKVLWTSSSAETLPPRWIGFTPWYQ